MRSNRAGIKRKEPSLLLVSIALFLGFLALMQNQYGQFSDIRGFYGMHFSDGENQWPFSYHTLVGSNEERHPVEYPALTGLVMWLISFLIPLSENSVIAYYTLTALLNTILFSYSAFLVKKLTDSKTSYLFILAPAVLYSLHRNWDIWALVPMLLAVYFFENKKYHLSALNLAIAVATKFFPIVLLLPITIFFWRNRKFAVSIRYALETLAFWALINLPFALINFAGWAYFYKFSYRRGFGGGSLYEMMSKLGLGIQVNSLTFYVLNCLIFIIIIALLIKTSSPIKLSNSAFFVLFAFTLFNKQYSMQYIIWLAPFAAITISQLATSLQKTAIKLYIFWQIIEFAFQYSFFQNILTNTGKSRGVEIASVEVSEFQYGVVSLFRYGTLLIFFVLLYRSVWTNRIKNSGAQSEKKK
jgi:uncharacterized membrane protein